MILTKERLLLVWAIAATLLAIILFNIKSCGSGPKKGIICSDADTIFYTDTIRDTIRIPAYKPKIVKITLPGEKEIDSIPYVDSNYCKQLAIDYLTQKEYLDTLIAGDSLDLIIWSRISKNSIDSVKPTLNIKIPYVKTVVTPIPKTPWKFYIGANFGTNGQGFIAGPEIILTDRNRMLYKAGVDFSTYTPPIYRLGFAVKFSFPKKK